MIHTVLAAAQHICPVRRIMVASLASGGSGNAMMPSAALAPDPPCIADRCMAWRWHETVTDTERNPASRCGYCGLAGTPGAGTPTPYHEREAKEPVPPPPPA